MQKSVIFQTFPGQNYFFFQTFQGIFASYEQKYFLKTCF